MRKMIQAIAAAFAASTYVFTGSYITPPIAPTTVLWQSYAQETIAPLVNEPTRETPPTPPPARLFVSAEGRYAIQKGWLAGADYQENKIATHGEAVAMLMQMAALNEDVVVYFGNFNPDALLTHQDFMYYLHLVFHNVAIEGALDPYAHPEDEVTWVEMARTAYRLRGLNPHSAVE